MFLSDDFVTVEEIPVSRWPEGDPDAEPLRLACEWDRARFAKHFLPHWCPDAFNKVHLDYYQLFADRQGSRGHRDVVAAPRGSSKTTGCALLGIIHDCCYHHEDFIVYITNRYDNARDKVRQIRDELESNQEIVRVFGPQVGATWNQDDFICTNGVRVLAAGRNTQVRGITNKQAQRPTKVVLDDCESSEHVLQAEQREKDLNWLVSDILRLGAPHSNFELSGTILHQDSLLAKTMKNPAWTPRFYQAVIRYADAESIPLWQQWRDLYLDLSNPCRQRDSLAFFEAHQEAMLAGSVVLWPERQNYRQLMEIRLADGESAYQCELMNDPTGDVRRLFHMDEAGYCTVMPEGILRADGKYIPFLEIQEWVGFLDPTPPKNEVLGSDWAACPIVVKDRDGYVYCIDCFMAQEAQPSKVIEGVVNLLWRWKVPLLGIESNGFASLLVQDIREAIYQRAQAEGVAWDVTLLPIVHMKNKMLRIKTLEPMVHNQWLQFSRDLHPEALREMAVFIPLDGADFDDFPDALEGACRVVRGLYDKRSPF